MKKLVSLILAIMMIAVCATAWASSLGQDLDERDDSTVISSGGVLDGATGDTTAITSTASVGNTVTFKKDIVIFNGSTSDTVVYLPNITYKYTISAAGITAGAPDVTDEYGSKAVVNDGVLTTTKGTVVSTTTDTISFSNSTGIIGDTTNSTTYVTTKQTGVVAEGTASFTFAPANYLHAGIYRYKITESLNEGSATREAAGIYNSGYHADRYLDVYVKNDKDSSNNDTFSIYGFVLFDVANKDADLDAANKDLSNQESSTNAYAGKTDGYVANATDFSTVTTYNPNELNVDMYYTYNLNVTKTTTGDLADKSYEFPFAARITNSTITSGAKFGYVENSTVGTGTTNVVTMTSAGIGEIGSFNSDVAASSSAIKLKDGENLYIYGIPSYGKKNNTINISDVEATALVSEYNGTYDIYKTKIQYTDVTNTATTDSTWNGVASTAVLSPSSTAATTLTTFKVDYEDPALIAVTNIMESVSPTGYVSRFAPYALILVAGIALLIVAKKRKPAKDEEE